MESNTNTADLVLCAVRWLGQGMHIEQVCKNPMWYSDQRSPLPTVMYLWGGVGRAIAPAAPIPNLMHYRTLGRLDPKTPFPPETAAVSDGIDGLGTGNARVPAKQIRKDKESMLALNLQPTKERCLTYMRPPSPNATNPSMKTLIARAQIPGAPTAHESCIT